MKVCHVFFKILVMSFQNYRYGEWAVRWIRIFNEKLWSTNCFVLFTKIKKIYLKTAFNEYFMHTAFNIPGDVHYYLELAYHLYLQFDS